VAERTPGETSVAGRIGARPRQHRRLARGQQIASAGIAQAIQFAAQVAACRSVVDAGPQLGGGGRQEHRAAQRQQ
jgi:hypothetical protein